MSMRIKTLWTNFIKKVKTFFANLPGYLKVFLSRVPGYLKKFWFNFFKFSAYVLFHPFDGFEDMKRYKKGKLSVAIAMMFLFALLMIVRFQYAGFLVNNNNLQDMNSLREIVSVFLIVILLAISNWSITTLMSGKGNMKEIFIVIGYSLWPALIIGFPNVILSNVLTDNEVAIYSLLNVISYIGLGWMLFLGLLNIHEYGLFKNILSLLLTAVAMAILIFVGLLFFDIIQQVINFIAQVFQELRLR